MFLKRFSALALLALAFIAGCGPESSRTDIARRWADQVETVGLAKFDAVDTDKNGVLSESELQAASKSPALTPTERSIFGHIYDVRDLVGHVVDSTTTTVPIMMPMPDGNGGFYYITTWQTTTTYYYGVSKQDLQTYKLRLRSTP